ncbi:MAG: hypothetical protein GY855_17055 [candidate division Zixibacteria bacterium]|nr:hypothetical protein [candidate division Zixibacteria bacterium]
MLKPKVILMLIVGAIFLIPGLQFCQETIPNQITYNNHTYKLHPEIYSEMPEIPSPLKMKDGQEIVTCITLDKKYFLAQVTVENGKLLDYKNRIWHEKGKQLDVDSADFPTLAKTGLHSEEELSKTKTITGKPVDEITEIGRPEEYSGEGFMSYDEDIISVLRGDNRLVNRLGMIHPEIAKPLFHVFNVIITVKKDNVRGNVKGIIYNGNEIFLRFWGAKGWQESIFNDEILGYWQIEMWRELQDDEKSFLEEKYSDLIDAEKRELRKKLAFIHTGEMVPFYAMRYGFYEGHTDYRADPIAICSIFGLKSIEEIEKSFSGELYNSLMKHFTKEK